MKLRNKSKDILKRRNMAGTWVRIQPGETIELPDSQAEYLLKTEKRTWSKVQPEKKKKGGGE